MSKKFEPMLAASMDEESGQTIHSLSYPRLASPKLDGIRCLGIDGVPHSRSLKPIPNSHVTRRLSLPHFTGLDGELMVGESFQAVTSGIMSVDGTPDFTFYVFDDFTNPLLPYQTRVDAYQSRVSRLKSRFPFVEAVEVRLVRCAAELDDFTKECESLGYEGSMVRDPLGHYKFGRATFKEGLLTKVKPFEDAEGEIVGFEEEMENRNEATTNELGRTKRSSHQANKVPKGTLGALICRNEKLWPGVTFNVGTGFTAAQRKQIWDNRAAYLGQLACFKFQRHGSKDRPRIPSFKAIRHPDDIS